MLVATAAGQVVVDTVGWTDRDHQMYGPAVRYVCNDTARGIHAVWKDSLGAICYNFRPRGQDWRWPDGMRISPYNRNLGSMDIEPAAGNAIIGFDFIFRAEPWSAYYEDSAAGAGRFTEWVMSRNHRHIVTACGRYGSPKFATARNDTAFHSSLFSFQRLGRAGPFPGHNISGARRSGRYCHTWIESDGPDANTLWLRETPNSGMQWFAPVNLTDSAPGRTARALLGAASLYDSIKLYVVTDFFDGRNRGSSEIWLYAKYDTPPWHFVHQHSVPDSGRLGDEALACCRPSIARSLRNGDLFAVWEQFDEDNVEPLTGLYRAAVWASRSQDSGATWGPARRLVGPDRWSWRFPFVAAEVSDSLRLICFPDSVAGFWEQGRGPRSLNPVVLLSVGADDLPVAVAEHARPATPVPTSPTLARNLVPGPKEKYYDAFGRAILPERPLPPGVYFVAAGCPARVRRVTIVR